MQELQIVSMMCGGPNAKQHEFPRVGTKILIRLGRQHGVVAYPDSGQRCRNDAKAHVFPVFGDHKEYAKYPLVSRDIFVGIRNVLETIRIQ